MADHARLGAEIRTRRESLGVTLREMARTVGLSPSTLSLVERGGPVIGADALGAIAAELRVDDATRERWFALSGRLPADLLALLLAHPERWGDVRGLFTCEVTGCESRLATDTVGPCGLRVCDGCRDLVRAPQSRGDRG